MAFNIKQNTSDLYDMSTSSRHTAEFAKLLA